MKRVGTLARPNRQHPGLDDCVAVGSSAVSLLRSQTPIYLRRNLT